MQKSSVIESMNRSEEWLHQAWENSSPGEFSVIMNRLRHQNDDSESQICYFLKKISVLNADNLAAHLVSAGQDSQVKIAFYCGYLTVGGADRVLTLLANHLTELGNQIYVNLESAWHSLF